MRQVSQHRKTWGAARTRHGLWGGPFSLCPGIGNLAKVEWLRTRSTKNTSSVCAALVFCVFLDTPHEAYGAHESLSTNLLLVLLITTSVGKYGRGRHYWWQERASINQLAPPYPDVRDRTTEPPHLEHNELDHFQPRHFSRRKTHTNSLDKVRSFRPLLGNGDLHELVFSRFNTSIKQKISNQRHIELRSPYH